MFHMERRPRSWTLPPTKSSPPSPAPTASTASPSPRDLGKGFTSDGADNAVTVFDIKTDKVLGEKIKTGTNPDSIIYEPVTHRVFTFNGRSSDSTAIDAKTNR